MKHEFVTKKCLAWLKVPVLNHESAAQEMNAYGLMIYAYLLHVARNKEGASQREIRARLKIDGRPVARALRSLATLGLVRVKNRRWWAEDPMNAAALFRWLREPIHTKGIGDGLCYVRTHLPSEDGRVRRITLITSLLYWKLVCWAEAVEGTGGHGAIDPRISANKGRRRGLSIRYLVRALRCDPKTIRQALKTLEQLELIRRVPLGNHYFAVAVFVREDHCRLWRAEWHAGRGASVAELFNVPSACEPKAASMPDLAAYLLRAGIPGTMHPELLSLSTSAGLEVWEWKDLLLKCQRDNDRNRNDLKSQVPHPGRLFRYELERRVQTRGINLTPARGANRLLAIDLVRRIPGSSRALIDLVSAAVTEGSVLTSSGLRMPCPWKWEDVQKLARDSTFKSFKEQFARRIFLQQQPGLSPWLDRWLALRPLPEKETAELGAMLGINSSMAWNEVEAWVASHCDDEYTQRVRTQEIVDAAVSRLTSCEGPRSLSMFRSVYQGFIEAVSPAWFSDCPSYANSIPYWPDELSDECFESAALHVA